jgi:hypothetical protein
VGAACLGVSWGPGDDPKTPLAPLGGPAAVH